MADRVPDPGAAAPDAAVEEEPGEPPSSSSPTPPASAPGAAAAAAAAGEAPAAGESSDDVPEAATPEPAATLAALTLQPDDLDMAFEPPPFAFGASGSGAVGPDHGGDDEDEINSEEEDEEDEGPEEQVEEEDDSGETTSAESSVVQDDGSDVDLAVASDIEEGADHVNLNDADSALGDDVMRSPSASSVPSSLFDFPEEFGRTWHRYKQGAYFLPNDDREQERLDLDHHIALEVFGGKYYFSPLDKPNRVLDVGTGTGFWAVEFAINHPESDVLGIDLSPIQPDYVPTNCRFEVDDCEAEWVWHYSFDYVHVRNLISYLISPFNMVASAYEKLSPGGWLEFQEVLLQFRCIDSSLENTTLEQWNDLLREGMRALSRDVYSPLRCREYLLDAGFINVEQKRFVIPMNTWAKGDEQKMQGYMQLQSNLEGLPALTLWVFSKGLGWTREEIELFLVDVRKDLTDRHIHAYFTMIAVWGQKPPAAPPTTQAEAGPA